MLKHYYKRCPDDVSASCFLDMTKTVSQLTIFLSIYMYVYIYICRINTYCIHTYIYIHQGMNHSVIAKIPWAVPFQGTSRHAWSAHARCRTLLIRIFKDGHFTPCCALTALETFSHSPLQQSGGGLHRTSFWMLLVELMMRKTPRFLHVLPWMIVLSRCLCHLGIIWAVFVCHVWMSDVFCKTKGFIWYAKYSASVDISTTPTTSSLVPKRFWSQMAWKTMRPIRPKPLIPILVAMTSERFQWKDSWNLRTECLSKRFHHVPVCCKHILCVCCKHHNEKSPKTVFYLQGEAARSWKEEAKDVWKQNSLHSFW